MSKTRPKAENSIIRLSSVDSTNSYAKRLFSELPDGTLVAADYQTAGRGRLTRKWVSPPGVNVCASYVIKRINDPFLATVVSSLAVLNTARHFVPEREFFIKWPNDVYCDKAKICGILSEAVAGNGRAEGIIAGMGLNVNMTEEDFKAIEYPGASLYTVSGRRFFVENVIAQLEKELRACYIIYSHSPEKLFALWKKENALLGSVLEFETPDGRKFNALFKDIDGQGRAVISEDWVHDCIFECGDVRIEKSSIGQKSLNQ